MADEPSESVAQATQAHECNGAREGSSCSNLSESGAAINDGATEKRFAKGKSRYPSEDDIMQIQINKSHVHAELQEDLLSLTHKRSNTCIQ